MKVAICIIGFEDKKWFFEQIAAQNSQIKKIEFFLGKRPPAQKYILGTPCFKTRKFLFFFQKASSQ